MSVNMKECLEILKTGKALEEKTVRILCEKVKEILIEENNVQPVSGPVTVVGDIHGQFYDLLEIFRIGGDVGDTSYIFLGDMVDRGYHSIETITYLICLKVLYPGKITLLRGNHESRFISQQYGFYDEVMKKYGNINCWKYFNDVFDHLPLSALIEGKILCLHGGLSPDLKTIDQIRLIDRFQEVPSTGEGFSDLMWSDPEDIDTWAISPRGLGWLFGSKVTDEFNKINGLDLICRAHQLVMEGYKIWFPNQNLTTVWSAPNYTYRCGNAASILQINSDLSQKYVMFDEAKQKAKLSHYSKVVPYFL
ncbi:unnamed protein product [Moneuplotes crassus]|uniref:Serine/threonine-protein phosphatase n=1 Tax=Euplotes crassus TaxID=5936 RepID=A0AAD1XKY7_EUPCR|nr:unnamed protein product [Moneuplotes crassus]